MAESFKSLRDLIYLQNLVFLPIIQLFPIFFYFQNYRKSKCNSTSVNYLYARIEGNAIVKSALSINWSYIICPNRKQNAHGSWETRPENPETAEGGS